MFIKEISEFTMSLDALLAYNEYIEPLVWENVKNSFKKEAIVMESLKFTFEKLEQLPQKADEKDVQKVKEEVANFFVGEVDFQYNDENGWAILTKEEDSIRVDKAVKNIKILEKQIELMYKSILINLVSTAECFLGDILKKYFSTYKGEIVGKLISKQDKIYTITELEEFESIEEAKEYIIDKKIGSLFRGSFEDWIVFLKDKMSLSMGYMDADKDTMVEIFQRRNLFIHNNGIINRIYISKVKNKYRYSDNIGEKIVLKKDYISNAIFLLQKNLILIAFELWKKREHEDKKRSRFFQELSFKYLEQGKWELLESATNFVVRDTIAPDTILKVAQINLWLSEKRLGKLNKCVVEKTDFSTSKIEYRICQKALLDKNDEAIHLIKRALDTNQIDMKTIYEWPVLSELRDTKEFKQMLKEKNIEIPFVDSLIYPQIEDVDDEGD